MSSKQQFYPGSARAVLVPLTLIVLAVVLYAGPWQLTPPITPAATVPDWAVSDATVRQPSMQAQTQISAFTYSCNECHRLFPSQSEASQPLTQHRYIELKHGINDRCFNCHHREDRNVLVDDRGAAIPFDQPQLLCAKCHGLVYRDWTHGVHGRTNGYWDARRGVVEHKNCVDCHDPHIPPFPPMPPAAGPHTLRTWHAAHGAAHAEPDTGNPLVVDQRPAETAEGQTGEHD